MKYIHLWGVRQNNLKDLEVKIPIGSFTVICGPSGSGKSSLAFETLYAEGQRRYIESLSNYTKQFLNKAPKPDIDGIDNIPPAISLEQKNSVKSSRSSVGTTTEIIDYLRLLFEKIGKAYCPTHHLVLEKQSPTAGTEKILKYLRDKRGYILTPIYADDRTLKDKKLLAQLIQDGILRIYLPAKPITKGKPLKEKKTDTKKSKSKVSKKNKSKVDKLAATVPAQKTVGTIIELNEKTKLPKEDFYIAVDRASFSEADRDRLTDSLSQAYHFSLKYNSHLNFARAEVITTEGDYLLLSEETSCSICEFSFPDIHSSLFSFNSPVGACETCKGFGNILKVDPEKVIPNPELTVAQGALKPFAMPSATRDKRELMNYCKKKKIDVHTPWNKLSQKHRDMLWQGDDDFWGIEGLFKYLETKKYKMHVRVFMARHKSPFQCPTCKGSRLKEAALQVFIDKKNIADFCKLTAADLLEDMLSLKLSEHDQVVCAEPYRQIVSRLGFLNDVGVGYLSLDRPTKTLSGGEYQRLNLSNQLGVGLSQTLYVLDEPTIGLHPRDNDRLISVLHKLNDLGNTLVVVEHDHDVINNATHLIEMGPGSGHLGGQMIFEGNKNEFYKSSKSITAPYLNPNRTWVPLRETRPLNINKYKYCIEMTGCRGHNLKNIDIKIPLNRIVTVTGVSGSGKSSLIADTLYPVVARNLNLEYIPALEHDAIFGLEHVKNVLFLDQSPIGTTARSNPVTYMKVYDAIRTVMASSNEARGLGYTPSTFSLNVDGGRCPVCKGLGVEIIDMMFMDDLEIPCDTCDGKKFRPEVLEITYRGKNIHQILNMTVNEAMDFFVNYPNIRRPLSLLKEVGLEYIALGQSSRTLSGGESQRLKIAREFSQSQQNSTLYILDEPTTGLHFKEIQLLIRVLNRLVDAGGSVILVEHNLEIVRASDYIIDLGPEAGAGGGTLIAAGTPEEIMSNTKSLTGQYLKKYLA
ncbi:MAG: excinuclease ABC subunit UvrA [Bdellovibrionales bacterium]|nr:excinuclease ABC subunit UvrA [Bdellovibrionales bacterium]